MIYKYNEFYNYDNKSLSTEERDEISSVGESATGIKNLILWFGPNPNSREVRVRVSNNPNDLSGNDIFSIIIPKYDIIGDVNNDFITNDILKSIISYIELNKDNIYKYSDGLICGSDFIMSLK
jgi:hypothetical protein